jgi:hypothetical protein
MTAAEVKNAIAKRRWQTLLTPVSCQHEIGGVPQ